MKVSRIPQLVLLAFVGITFIIMLMFYLGGYADVAKEIPNYTGLALNWSIVLFFIAVIVALAFFIFKIVSDPKGSMKSIFGLVVLGVVFLIAWGLGSGEILELPEYKGPDNVYSKLKLADMMLYSALILFIGLILIIFIIMLGDLIKRVRKF